VTFDGVFPLAQRLDVGDLVILAPLAVPHIPVATYALQLTVVPSVQLHIHGPDPDTAEAVLDPAQRAPPEGAVTTLVPLAVPHLPTGGIIPSQPSLPSASTLVRYFPAGQSARSLI
jgi:hypothetical protein